MQKCAHYQGAGLTAVARDARHAERAVQAALAITRLVRAGDEARAVLGLERLEERWLGLATGQVILGEVGTARHSAFTLVGPAVSLAARLLAVAAPGCPVADRPTYEAARNARPLGPSPHHSPGPAARLEVWGVIRPA